MTYALPPRELAAFRARLTTEEQARAASFHFDRDRNQFVVGRALARTLVGRARGVPAESVTFVMNAYGCPYLPASDDGRGDAPSELHFNLSHTASVVACGVGRGFDFGVDVEDVRPVSDLADVARASFTKEEVASVLALPVAQRTRRFFDHWTLKEAYIKARRRGLSLPLDQFGFTLEGGRPTITFGPSLADDAAAWRFEQHVLRGADSASLGATLLAVAARADAVDIALDETTTAALAGA